MATPQEKLTEALEALKALQDGGTVAIRSTDLSRLHRERLLKNGFLQEVMKGWYIPTRPDETAGESTAWYAAFWPFCAAYLQTRFDDEWCLSPEQSLALHAGNQTVPRQLGVRAPRGGNKPTALPFGTSLFDIRASLPAKRDIVEKDALRLYALPAALIEASPAFFQHHAVDARATLASIQDASEILGLLLEGGHTTIAGRLAGAFRNIGRDRVADDILSAMRAAGYDVREQDPFDTRSPLRLPRREVSPYAGRICLMWGDMRERIIERFPEAPGKPNDIDAYLKRVSGAYVTDAYHSLSIEGYRVSPALIDRVRSGDWNPETDEQDREHRDALAARGYWLAYQEVLQSLGAVLKGENPGAVADDDHGAWYRALFAPSVTSGLLRPADLAGYRGGSVFIRRSMHVPPSSDSVRDAMPLFFELLTEETDPAVRVVLGHFIFVYIHPYSDGNGRMGRFLMNVMLGAGGYPWTVVPVEQRAAYMAALEEASVWHDIAPFADILGELVQAAIDGKQQAKLPT
jgi:hypothetical protein